MIHEFAIEPALVASWHDRQAYRFFDGKFGIGTKRVICRYPGKKWKRLVMDSFHEFFGEIDDKIKKQAAKKRLDALIAHLERGATRRNNGWNATEGWLTCALREHDRRPFHGIVVINDYGSHHESVLKADDIDEASVPWSPEPVTVERTRVGIAAELRPALLHARQVVLVDPYFNPSKTRWRRLFTRILEIAQANRAPDESVSFEVHCSVDHLFGRERPQSTEEEQVESKALVHDIYQAAQRHLTAPSTLLIRVWSDKIDYRGKELLHNRYLLTESGGIKFGHGLDTPSRGTEDLTLLSYSQWRNRSQVYSSSASEFRLIAQLDVVEGL